MCSANAAHAQAIIDLSKVTCRVVSAQYTVSCGVKWVTHVHLNPHELNFSIFSLSPPLNSDECRQSSVGLVTDNMVSHWRQGGAV